MVIHDKCGVEFKLFNKKNYFVAGKSKFVQISFDSNFVINTRIQLRL